MESLSWVRALGAKVVELVMVAMPFFEKIIHVICVVSVRRFKIGRWKSHCNDLIVDVCQVKVVLFILKTTLLFTHKVPQASL